MVDYTTPRSGTVDNKSFHFFGMSAMSITPQHEPEYAWELATLYPVQGDWSEYDYLALTDHAERRIELSDGRLEFLPMPTEIHEAILQVLYFALHQFVAKRDLGKVYGNGIRLRVRADKIRLPDVIFLDKGHFYARHNRVWDGADLVMEVVSDDPRDEERDYRQKLADYAEAKIAEHWIVDYVRQVVIVHRLEGDRYVVHGEFHEGQQAGSALLPEFSVDVASLFAAADEVPE
jgi:Uma2 family endonuclease